MSLGNKLLELRKSKQLSQEEVADILNVTRQTISKWETDQSTPDFDKIVPLCELYNITADELLTGKKSETSEEEQINQYDDLNKTKRASGIGKAILLYFIAIAWVMVAIPVLMINPIVASAIFLIICGIATYLIVYTCIVYKKKKSEKQEREDKLRKQIEDILSIITVIIYLSISFITMAWHITWIIWIVFGLVTEILKLVFMLRSNKDEK